MHTVGCVHSAWKSRWQGDFWNLRALLVPPDTVFMAGLFLSRPCVFVATLSAFGVLLVPWMWASRFPGDCAQASAASLQRETLLRQLETNQLDIDATLEELSVQQETEDQNYSMYVSLGQVGPCGGG